MEHTLLAFVRLQDAPSNESSGPSGSGPGNAASLSVPARLKDWIPGYLAMLPEPAARSSKYNRLQSHHETRTMRVVGVWRNVRMYAPDLSKTAGSRATRSPSWAHNLAIGSEWPHRCSTRRRDTQTVSRSACTFPLIYIHIRSSSHRPTRRSLPLPQYPHWEIA